VVALVAIVVPDSGAAEPPITVSEARADDRGFLVHTVRSPYQPGTTEIRVLLPPRMKSGARYPVVYLLPVEPGNQDRYGDGLREIQEQRLAERFPAIFVAPTFAQLPWYADHPTDREVRQESHFLAAVVPFVDEHYPARPGKGGRLLLGFSKSGWGAFSLLLRHPDRFGKAAAWDAPLMEQRPERFGMRPIFGTQENFEQYRLTTLFERRGAALGDSERLIVLGYGNFRAQHEQAHALLVERCIPHVYRDGPRREHHWGSGWVAEALELLLPDAAEAPTCPTSPPCGTPPSSPTE
jgi:enterochelin esterase-like enzyme